MIEWKEFGDDYHGSVNGRLQYKAGTRYGRTIDDKYYVSSFKPIEWKTFGIEVNPYTRHDTIQGAMAECENHHQKFGDKPNKNNQLLEFQNS
jgi:hypothetical protein